MFNIHSFFNLRWLTYLENWFLSEYYFWCQFFCNLEKQLKVQLTFDDMVRILMSPDNCTGLFYSKFAAIDKTQSWGSLDWF